MGKIHAIFRSTGVNRSKFAGLIGLCLVHAVLYILYINYMKVIINNVIQYNMAGVREAIVFFVFFAITHVLTKRMIDWASSKMSVSLEKQMKARFFFGLFTAPTKILRQYETMDLVNHFSEEIPQIVNFQVRTIVKYASDLFLLIGIVTYVAVNNVHLLIFLLLAPPIIVITNTYAGKSRQTFGVRQKKKAIMGNLARDIVTNAASIRTYLAERFFRNKYHKAETDVVCSEKKLIEYERMGWIINVAGYQLIYILFYVFGGILAFHNKIEFGVIVSLFVVLDPLVEMIQSLARILPDLHRADFCCQRYDSMNYSDTEGLKACSIEIPFQVEVNHLTYAYPDAVGKKHAALDDISFEFSSLDKVAIIGENGSGKSTFLSLLLGEDDAYNGEILIQGINLKQIESEKIQAAFSYLPQHIDLFSDTIFNNIQLTVPGEMAATEFKDQFKRVHIDEEIQEFEDGYNTVLVNGGENISEGQKQRLALVIALIKRRPMLILDESLSAIDPATQQAICDDFCTQNEFGVILVTHTTKRDILKCFDKVVLFKEGKVVACGNYSEIYSNPYFLELSQKEAESCAEFYG